MGDHFRSLWGKEAGWAHSVLFTADLRAFSERLKVEIKTEDVDIKQETLVVNVSDIHTMNVKKEESVGRDQGDQMVNVKEERIVVRDSGRDTTDVKREIKTNDSRDDSMDVKEETIVSEDVGASTVVKAELNSTPVKPIQEMLMDEDDKDIPNSNTEASALVEPKIEVTEEKLIIKREGDIVPRRSKRQKRNEIK